MFRMHTNLPYLTCEPHLPFCPRRTLPAAVTFDLHSELLSHRRTLQHGKL